MQQLNVQKYHLIRFFTFLSGFISLLSNQAFAQNSMMAGTCPMCGNGMGWVGMAFGSLMMISVVVALVALSVYLFRRAGPR